MDKVSDITMRYWMRWAINNEHAQSRLSPPQAEEARVALTQCLEMAEASARLRDENHALQQRLDALSERLNTPIAELIDVAEVDLQNAALRQALQDIVDQCPNPKLPYGVAVVGIAKAALKEADHAK